MSPLFTQTVIALGGNIGDAQRRLNAAFDALELLPASWLSARSSLYRTPPWGITEQREFVNAVALVQTALDPHSLLLCIKNIEKRAGRQRRERWGPRELDLDIIGYGDRTVHDDALQIPHPRCAERPFVMIPLAEIASSLCLPGLAKSAGEFAAAMDPLQAVRIEP